MPLLLVRHAKAGTRKDWKGDDLRRPLTPPGLVQAKGIVDQLVPFKVTRLLSSPYTRCVQTMEPIAKATGLDVEIAEQLAEGRPRKAVKLLRSLAGGPCVALCTHGDIVLGVLEALADADGARFGPPLEWNKGSTWVLHTDGERFTGGDYLPPPS